MVIELDCSELARAIADDEVGRFAPVIAEIREWQVRDWMVELVLISKDINLVADRLARMGASGQHSGVCVPDSPLTPSS